MATVRLQLRRGLADDWYDANPTLAAGEIGIETDTNTFKFGDGNTAWRDLDYALSGTVDDFVPLNTKAQAGGVASLDSNGFVPVSQLPPLAKVTVSAVSDETARLALTAEPGDIAIQSDNGTTYVLSASPATNNSNWREISATAAISAAVSAHQSDTTNVHGIADTADLATKSYADTAVSNHESDTTSVHGIADTSLLVTTTGTQTLMSKSLTSPTLTGTPVAPTAAAGTDTTQIATTAFVQDAIELVVGAAPAALNTLAEIATSLNNNADLAGSLTNSISLKLDKAGDTMSGVLNMSSNKVTGLATPTVASDAVNKSYADQLVLNSISDHSSDQTNVHGITDTQNLVYTSDTRLSDVRVPQVNSVSTDKIQDDAVTTAKIVNEAVTGAKLAPTAVTTAKIENAAVTTTKIADGSVIADKIGDNAVVSAKIQNSAVTTAKIADLGVTNAKIAENAVNTSNLIDSSVTTAKIADLNVTAGKIADSAVTTDKINNSSVTEAKIAGLSVTEGKISDGAVSTAKIADSAVTTVKLANDSVTTGKIAADTIVNADINPSAAISQSKISGLVTDLADKAPLASPTFTGTVSGVTKAHVGLANVDNTSDANKPVSTATQTALDAKLNLAGATMTGALTLSGAPTSDLHAATKLYVDNVAAGINFHEAVHAASTQHVAANYANGTSGVGATLTADTNRAFSTIDGESVVVGERVLIKNQNDAKQNGIYVLTTNGSASAPWVLTRATDSDNNPSGEMKSGDFTFVQRGTVNGSVGYINNSAANPIVIGTDSISYTEFNAAKAVSAGSGLTEATPGTISIAAGGVTSAMILDGTIATGDIADGAITTAKIAEGAVVTVDIADGAVTSAKIANDTIVDADINSAAAIAQSKISGLSTSLGLKANLADPTFTGTVTVGASGIAFTDGSQTRQGVPSLTTIASATTGAYNLSSGGLALRDQLIPIGGAHAITVPTNATTAYPVGTSISFYQSAGTGGNFVAADGTVTILSTPGSTLRTTNSSATITKVATNTWLLAGDLRA